MSSLTRAFLFFSLLSYLLSSSLPVQLIDKAAVVDLSEIVHVPEREGIDRGAFGVLALGELEDIADRRKGRVGLFLQDGRELFVHVLDDVVVPALVLVFLRQDRGGLRLLFLEERRAFAD